MNAIWARVDLSNPVGLVIDKSGSIRNGLDAEDLFGLLAEVGDGLVVARPTTKTMSAGGRLGKGRPTSRPRYWEGGLSATAIDPGFLVSALRETATAIVGPGQKSSHVRDASSDRPPVTQPAHRPRCCNVLIFRIETGSLVTLSVESDPSCTVGPGTELKASAENHLVEAGFGSRVRARYQSHHSL